MAMRPDDLYRPAEPGDELLVWASSYHSVGDTVSCYKLPWPAKCSSQRAFCASKEIQPTDSFGNRHMVFGRGKIVKISGRFGFVLIGHES